MSYEGNTMAEGKLEQLEAQVDRYLAEKNDWILADYLIKLKERIHNQKLQVNLLQEELDRSYQMYLRRTELAERVVQNPVTMEEKVNLSEDERLNHKNIIDNAVSNEDVLGEFPQENPQYIEFHDVQPPQVPVKKSSGGAEFMIGTAILSIVGGTFILAALVMLGMYFMNGFVKGMCMYGGALLLLVVSELLIHRKWPKLATVFSAIGIGGLYLSTVLNFLTLHNFDMLVAVIITFVITVFVVLLSRKRDSVVYRILGLCSSYLCIMTVGENLSTVEFGMLSGIIFLINILCIVIPIQKHKAVFHTIHIGSNLLFAYSMDFCLADSGLPLAYRLLMAIGLLAVMQLIFVAQTEYERKEAALGNKVDSVAVKIFYWLSIAGFSDIFGELFRENTEVTTSVRYGSVVAVCIICMTAIISLRKSAVKWYPYYLLNLTCWAICCYADNELETIICLLALLTIAKVLSLWRIPALKLSDAAITTLTCIALLAYGDENGLIVYLLLAGVGFSILFISQWQTYFEILLMYTLGFFAIGRLDTMLQLPMFVGLLFVGILLFNNVGRFRGKHIIVYNIFALVGEVICFLFLMNPIYQNAFLTYLCMLVFGLATIVLTFQEKYCMNFKNKNLIVAFFLTYMALVVRTHLPVVNSILLMLIALVCVGIGFFVKEKAIRIYGLVLSLLVCGKIVLYDYSAVPMLQKTVLFFSVGVIALIIAGIYIILEKKNSRD